MNLRDVIQNAVMRIVVANEWLSSGDLDEASGVLFDLETDLLGQLAELGKAQERRAA